MSNRVKVGLGVGFVFAMGIGVGIVGTVYLRPPFNPRPGALVPRFLPPSSTVDRIIIDADWLVGQFKYQEAEELISDARQSAVFLDQADLLDERAKIWAKWKPDNLVMARSMREQAAEIRQKYYDEMYGLNR